MGSREKTGKLRNSTQDALCRLFSKSLARLDGLQDSTFFGTTFFGRSLTTASFCHGRDLADLALFVHPSSRKLASG